MNRIFKNALFYFLILVVVVWGFATFLGRGGGVEEIKYSPDFVNRLQRGEIKSVRAFINRNEIEGELSSGDKYQTSFGSAEALDALMLEHNRVEYDPQAETPSIWWTLLVNALPIIIIIGLFFFLMNQMQGGGNRVMAFGKSKAKLVTKDQPKITFNDVAGADEAVEELVEIKEFLENPAKFQQMGAKIPKGVLLFGPPGAGKTLLARAVAGEAGVPFFSISGSDFVEMFVGVGAARVRDLFEQAKSNSPAIVFVDEIDAVGRHRGAGLGGGHDEREQTLNQLLVEMDGFDTKTGVILMAATNRPDILDPALLRPGRFDRQIVVDRPDLKGRESILTVHSRGKPLDDEVDMEVIARRTPGFTGADLANVINEAALLSARQSIKAISMLQLEEAIDRVIAGPERKSRLISDSERKVIAYHEAGHALVSWALPNADPVHKVSIISRGRALGYTLTLPMEDKFLSRRSELIDELAMLLGGRCAEELVFKDPTTGAQDDLDRASKIARKMVCEYGMSEKLGPVALGEKIDQPFLGRDMSTNPDYSDQIASEIDIEIRRLIDEAHVEATEICTTHRKELDAMVDALVENETVKKEEVEKIFAGVPKRAARGIPIKPKAGKLTDKRAAAKAKPTAKKPSPTKRRRSPGAEPATA